MGDTGCVPLTATSPTPGSSAHEAAPTVSQESSTAPSGTVCIGIAPKRVMDTGGVTVTSTWPFAPLQLSS